MNPAALLRLIRASTKGHEAADLVRLMQEQPSTERRVSLDPYDATISYDPLGYRGKSPYVAWESRALPMDDADLPTSFDTHSITGKDAQGRSLGEALDRARDYVGRYPEELLDIQLTPGGAHAFELGTSRGRPEIFSPFQDLSDTAYSKVVALRGGRYAARLSPKPERLDVDFGAVPFTRVGRGRALPYKEDLLTLHNTILRDLYPATQKRHDAIRTLAAHHERSLSKHDAALLRAIYGLGVAGAAANLGEDPDA